MAEGTCAVNGCGRPLRARGWCAIHYRRWQRHGDVLADVPVRPPHGRRPRGQLCDIEGCGKTVAHRSWCHGHYYRWLRYDDPRGGRVPKPPPTVAPGKRGCLVDDCTRPHDTGGYCGMHWRRLLAAGTVADPQPRIPPPCSVGGCEQAAVSLRLCKLHYSRHKDHGDQLAQVRHRNQAPPDTCTVGGCNGPHRAKGLCGQHYRHHYYVMNREKRGVQYREYYRRNPQRYRARDARYRMASKATMDQLDRELAIAYRKVIANDPCAYCGGPGEEVDHYFPVSKGGRDFWWNLVRACGPCNRRKFSRCGTWFRLRPDLQGIT